MHDRTLCERRQLLNNIGDDVLEVGALFEHRLPPEILASALDYVQFNEAGLALEILCEQLVEYDVKISASEYARFRSMADVMYPDAHILTPLAAQVAE